VTPVETMLAANGIAWAVALGQLLRIERRLGCGDSSLKQIKSRCPIFMGGVCDGKETESKEVGQDRRS